MIVHFSFLFVPSTFVWCRFKSDHTHCQVHFLTFLFVDNKFHIRDIREHFILLVSPNSCENRDAAFLEMLFFFCFSLSFVVTERVKHIRTITLIL